MGGEEWWWWCKTKQHGFICDVQLRVLLHLARLVAGRQTEEMALQRNEWGQNLLVMAAESGSLPICGYLMGLMDVMHPKAERHAGALKSALQMRNYDIFKLLVTKANADVNFLYQYGMNLMTAAQSAAIYHSEMLQWMVDHDLVDLEQENESVYRGSNLLRDPAYAGNVESVRILLAAGANVNAAMRNAGADPTAVFDRGEHGSALTAAAFYGQRDFLKAVIDRVGVDKAIDVFRQGRHPGKRIFVDQNDVEYWRDTAAYLANEVGASKDILHGIGLWDVEPVRTGYGNKMEIRFTEYSQPNSEDSNI
ncbi:hypothetical protein ACHAPV_000797 [Trichoderma viride]